MERLYPFYRAKIYFLLGIVLKELDDAFSLIAGHIHTLKHTCKCSKNEVSNLSFESKGFKSMTSTNFFVGRSCINISS